MAKKRLGQFRMRMKPENGGAYTRWWLCGSVPTAVSRREMQQVMRMLSFWSGWPVVLALCVEAKTAGWLEWWTHVLAEIPARHLQVRFVRRALPVDKSRRER